MDIHVSLLKQVIKGFAKILYGDSYRNKFHYVEDKKVFNIIIGYI